MTAPDDERPVETCAAMAGTAVENALGSERLQGATTPRICFSR